jgi:hypothetical protein
MVRALVHVYRYVVEYVQYTFLVVVVTEINAPDLAAGDVGGAGVVAEGNDGDAILKVPF